MDEKIINQLRLLKEYIEILSTIGKTEMKAYLQDKILIGSAERYLQLAIETCLNIGNRIASLEQINTNIKPPETYSDIFENLYLLKLIDKDFSADLKNMAGLRNRLVHMYWDLDNSLIYDIMQNKLGSFEKFIRIISGYLRNKSENQQEPCSN
jgi:uncharacterized protein YutE (UPF0331/DUF86 family)